MGRRGNPYDNAKAESFMKTLKVEAVYPMAYETFNEVAADIPRSAISARSSSRINTLGSRSKPQPDPVYPQGRIPNTGPMPSSIMGRGTRMDRYRGLLAADAALRDRCGP